MVVLRKALLRYDAAATEEEKAASLAEIREHVHWSHDYTKPTNLKKITKREDAKADDETDEEDEELRRYETAFNQADTFSRAKLVDSLVSNNQAQLIHQVCY